MIRRALVVLAYVVLLPVGAYYLFQRLVPSPNTVFGRERNTLMSPALQAANDRLNAVWDTVRALDDAYARVRALGLARRAAAGIPAPSWDRPLERTVAPSGVTLHAEALVSAKTREMVLAIIGRELKDLGRTAPAAPIAVVAVVDSALTYPRYRRAVVLPADKSGPCTVVIYFSFRMNVFTGVGNTDRLLGTCAFQATYGPMGDGVRDWLHRTRLRNAAFLQPPATHGSGAPLSAREVNLLGSNVSVVACRTGRLDACDALFDADRAQIIAPYEMRRTIELMRLPDEVLLSSPNTFAFPSTIVTNGLLAAAAEHLGPARFGAVWSSDRPIREAFEAEAGRPVAEWVASFLESRMPAYESGPALSAGQWVTWLLLLAGASALAIARTRRSLT